MSLWLVAWGGATALEAGLFAYSAGRMIYGPASLSPDPALWLSWVLGVMVAYWVLSAVAASPRLTALGSPDGTSSRVRLWAATLPFLGLLLLESALLQLRPDTMRGWTWSLLSPIEPFPSLAVALGILLVALAKYAVTVVGLPRLEGPLGYRLALPAEVGFVLAMVVLGTLQAAVYIAPIGNAFLRSWAITDAVISGTGYPVTVTELPTFLAGGPPYIRDLPLFPLMLLGSFQLLGHDTLAAHLPAFLASSLFPLSLFLLLREATGSRLLSIVFAAAVSMFPFLRFWVLNLPDPDALMFTGLCFTGYLYLRAASVPQSAPRWLAAGVAGGLLSLVRSEGILYAGFIGLVVLLLRPGAKGIALFVLGLAVSVVPMVAVWMANFGIPWPQNFNGTLSLRYPGENLEILRVMDAFGIYQRGLGLDSVSALLLLSLLLATVAAGFVAAALRKPCLLALLIPGIGNFVSVFFTAPGVTNAAHFADFFRHASFGIPFMTLTSAFGLATALRAPKGGTLLRLAVGLVLLLLVVAVAREGDILANPTATHRPGATQVLTTSTHLSMHAIAARPLDLPPMTYHWNGEVTVAYPTFMEWPEGIHDYFKPLDMTFDSAGRPFGYASLIAFVIALGFAVLSDSGCAKTQGRR